jgi:hypothetical protein
LIKERGLQVEGGGLIMEYLFRGKRVDNGKWMYGYPWGDNGAGFPDIITNKDGAYQVDPDTVGLCSSLPDKNGKKIFQGDIILWGDKQAREAGGAVYAVVEFRSGCFGISESGRFHEFWHYLADKWDDTEITVGMWGDMPIEQYFRACFEVVGNRWDNPELLKEVDNP